MKHLGSMTENIDKYLDALTNCNLSGDSFTTYRLNGLSMIDYDNTMEELYLAFKFDVLASAFSVPEFIAITRRVDEAKKRLESVRKEIEKIMEGNVAAGFPAVKLLRSYMKWVEKTAELVENVNIMKLAQATPAHTTPATEKEATPEVKPSAESEPSTDLVSTPSSAPTEEQEVRRNISDKRISHPGEYWGYEEMMKGEGISRASVAKTVKDPYFLPARRYVAGNLRVNIAKLHELQQKQSEERHKPIGDHPRRGKK